MTDSRDQDIKKTGKADGEKFPIMYISNKFKEKNYSDLQRECLAVVWAVQKFEAYLYGREFIIETDHQPLLCLRKSKVANQRVMRWALSLQPYRYRESFFTERPETEDSHNVAVGEDNICFRSGKCKLCDYIFQRGE